MRAGSTTDSRNWTSSVGSSKLTMLTATSSFPPPILRPFLKQSGVVSTRRHGRVADARRRGPDHGSDSSRTQGKGKLGEQRIVDTWVSTHLTDAQKADPTEYEPGDLLQFHQNAPGYKKGSRLIVTEKAKPPTKLAKRFEAYRPARLALAVGDRVRITAGGKTKDGKHRLSNGSLLSVEGFTKRGDIIVDHGWVIDRDFGHLTHGYVVTSHASQGVTVDKVFVGISSQSLPATDQRTAYVALTRGKEQAQIFTDDRKELLKAMAGLTILCRRQTFPGTRSRSPNRACGVG